MATRQISRAGVRLSDFPVFHGLSPSALARAQSLLTEVQLPADRLLCEEGGIGREAFFILRGSAVVIRDGRGIATVGPGDVVGEGALLGDGWRTATVRTTEPLTALVMSVREFLSLLELPGVGAAIHDIAVARGELGTGPGVAGAA